MRGELGEELEEGTSLIHEAGLIKTSVLLPGQGEGGETIIKIHMSEKNPFSTRGKTTKKLKINETSREDCYLL